MSFTPKSHTAKTDINTVILSNYIHETRLTMRSTPTREHVRFLELDSNNYIAQG